MNEYKRFKLLTKARAINETVRKLHALQADVAVAISLGEGIDLWVTKTGDLCIGHSTEPGPIIELGPATINRFVELQKHISRLSIHAAPH